MKNVFAHYYTWFGNKKISGSWQHWNWDGPLDVHDPDRLIDGRADIAAVDMPLIGAYDSSDPFVHRYHLDLAEAAGIDAFCVDWYGLGGEGQPPRGGFVDANFRSMLELAGGHRVKMCFCYEEKLLSGAGLTADQAIQLGRQHFDYIASTFAAEGYWRVDGRPVLIIWGNNRLPVEAWREILRSVNGHKPWVLYSHHDHNPGYVEICHGFYPWVLIGDLGFQRNYLDDYYRTVKGYLDNGGSSTWAGGVWPGFNDAGVSGWGSGTRIVEDPGDQLLDLTWEYVLRHNPDWVSITTWNDWNEGSNIEPGEMKGARYLSATAEYVARYKGRPAGIRIEDVLRRHLA